MILLDGHNQTIGLRGGGCLGNVGCTLDRSRLNASLLYPSFWPTISTLLFSLALFFVLSYTALGSASPGTLLAIRLASALVYSTVSSTSSIGLRPSWAGSSVRLAGQTAFPGNICGATSIAIVVTSGSPAAGSASVVRMIPVKVTSVRVVTFGAYSCGPPGRGVVGWLDERRWFKAALQ